MLKQIINMAKNSQDNILPLLTHILGIFTYFIGSLIIYLTSEDKKTKKHSKNALNWQLSLVIYFGCLLFLGIFVAVLESISSGFAILILPLPLLITALSILNVVFSILAAVKANENKYWDYPLTLNLIK